MKIINVGYDDGILWSPGIDPLRTAGRALARGFNRQVREATGRPLQWLLGRASAALHGMLGAHFGDEVDTLAAALDVEPRDLLVANLAYDLSNAASCSTFVVDTPDGPLHARNMDWIGPGDLLRKHTIAVHVDDPPAGPYSLVTWPGFFGGLTGVAPGRFSVTVNFVVHPDNGPVPMITRAIGGFWPVPFAVRIALDTCRTYTAAVRYLSTVPLLSPVLFTVAGTRTGEGVVIERSPMEYAICKVTSGYVMVTNHYCSNSFSDENADLSEMDTEDRYCCVEKRLDAGLPTDPPSAFRVLSGHGVLRDDTQHQVVMQPASGGLWVRVPGERIVDAATKAEARLRAGHRQLAAGPR